MYHLDDRAILLPLASKALKSLRTCLIYFATATFKLLFEEITISSSPNSLEFSEVPSILIDPSPQRKDLMAIENAILHSFPDKKLILSFKTSRKILFAPERIRILFSYLLNSSTNMKYSRLALQRANKIYLYPIVYLANCFYLAYLHTVQKYVTKNMHSILFLFTFKDMNPIPNAFIQFLNIHRSNIYTYTSQHASYRPLSLSGSLGMNDINILAVVSKYFLSWGPYVKDIVSANTFALAINAGPPALCLPTTFDDFQITVIHDNSNSKHTNEQMDLFGHSLLGTSITLAVSFHPSELPKSVILPKTSSRVLGTTIIGRNSNLLALCCFFDNLTVYLHKTSSFSPLIIDQSIIKCHTGDFFLLTNQSKLRLIYLLFNYSGPLISFNQRSSSSSWPECNSYFEIMNHITHNDISLS